MLNGRSYRIKRTKYLSHSLLENSNAAEWTIWLQFEFKGNNVDKPFITLKEEEILALVKKTGKKSRKDNLQH